MNNIEKTAHTKEPNGAAATALLLFFGVGFITIASVAAAMMRHSIFDTSPIKYLFIFVPWIFTFHFGAIGLLLIFLAIFGQSNPDKNKLEFAKRLGRKSLVEQWKTGIVFDSNSEALAWSVFSLIYKTLLVLPPLGLGIYDFQITREPNLGLIFAVLPLISILKIIIAKKRVKDFGRSKCRIQKGFSASSVKFQFESERGHESITKYEVVLRSEKRSLVRSDKNQHLRTDVLLKLEKEIAVTQATSSQGGISVDYSIPDEALPSTSPEQKEGIFWILTVKGIRPGVDYFAEFVVPIKYASV